MFHTLSEIEVTEMYMNPPAMLHIATICQNEQLMAYVYMIPSADNRIPPTIVTSYVHNKITKHTNEVTVKQSLNNLFNTEQIGDTWVPIDIRAFRINEAGYCSYSYIFDYPILEVRWSDLYTRFGVLEFNLIDIRKLFLSDDEIIGANMLSGLSETVPENDDADADADVDVDADADVDNDVDTGVDADVDEESGCSECDCTYVYSILVEPPKVARMSFATPPRTSNRTTPPSLNRRRPCNRRRSPRISPRTLFSFEKPATKEIRRSDRIAAKTLRRSSRPTNNPYKI